MDLKETIYKRQSIRKFKAGDVPDSALEEMVKAAGQAPSGKNIQNWHFICIKNKDLIEKISGVLTEKNESIAAQMDIIDPDKGLRFRKFLKNFTLFYEKAPVLVVVYTTTYHPSGYHELTFINAEQSVLDDILNKRSPGMQSLGAAIQNFTLSAIEQGFGSCWLTSANYAATEIEALLKQEIGFDKEGYYLGAMLALGIPEDGPKSPKKKPLEEIYTLVK